MSALIACHGCDLLVDISDISHPGQANCPRCGHFLTRCLDDGFMRTLAYAVSAATFLAVALMFPFLSMEAQGLSSSMTLPGTALEL